MVRRLRWVVGIGAATGAVLLAAPDAVGASVSTVRASVSSSGAQGDLGSDNPAISPDGRYVAFTTGASTLGPKGTASAGDVMLHDLHTGKTRLVSVSSSGKQGNDISGEEGIAISAGGRYVAFESYATNLAGNSETVTNMPDFTYSSVYLRDMQQGKTTKISVPVVQAWRGNYGSQNPAISADGRYIAFDSDSARLISKDTNKHNDVFVRDTRKGVTRVVSLSTSGRQGNGDSQNPSISADGRYVVFDSMASNLVAGDTNRSSDVFIRDLVTGTTRRLSVSSGGRQANSGSDFPKISADGQHVAFVSWATNLVKGANGNTQAYVRDLRTGKTTLVSVSSAGVQSVSSTYFNGFYVVISGTGRYVAFTTDDPNLVPGDTNNAGDVFLHDRQTGSTQRVSLGSTGAEGDEGCCFFPPALSADGKYLAFGSDSTNLVPGDTNSSTDVFVRGPLH